MWVSESEFKLELKSESKWDGVRVRIIVRVRLETDIESKLDRASGTICIPHQHQIFIFKRHKSIQHIVPPLNFPTTPTMNSPHSIYFDPCPAFFWWLILNTWIYSSFACEHQKFFIFFSSCVWSMNKNFLSLSYIFWVKMLLYSQIFIG